jgi:hypothetical protein
LLDLEFAGQENQDYQAQPDSGCPEQSFGSENLTPTVGNGKDWMVGFRKHYLNYYYEYLDDSLR